MSEENNCAKIGEFSWNELITQDTKASGKFYKSLFGWKPTPFTPKGTPKGAPPYTIFKTDPKAEMGGAGGMMKAMHPKAPTQWIPYVSVADADKSLAKAVKLGAKVCLPVTSIGEVGRIAVFQDPQGATIGLHEMPK